MQNLGKWGFLASLGAMAVITLLVAGGQWALAGDRGKCHHKHRRGVATPIPVQPWMADQLEERLNNPSDFNTVVLGPIPPGYRPLCEDPPDRAAIVRALPRTVRGIPYVYEERRDEVDIAIERLVDEIDAPRFYPLIGPAQVHRCHYRCSVYFTETLTAAYPVPFDIQRRRVEVVYLDRDHLHLYQATEEEMQEMTKDLTQYQP
jgi:hypothetical protein